MKFKELNLNRMHYVMEILEANDTIIITKCKLSEIREGYHFGTDKNYYLYPMLYKKHAYVGPTIIVSLGVDPEEEVKIINDNCIRWNYHKFPILHEVKNYIVFDIHTVVKLVKEYFITKYNRKMTEEERIYGQTIYHKVMKEIKMNL